MDGDEEIYYDCSNITPDETSSDLEGKFHSVDHSLYNESTGAKKKRVTKELKPSRLMEHKEEDAKIEELLSEEQSKSKSISFKIEGNEKYKWKNYSEAKTLYTEGLNICPISYNKERAVLYANRGACHMNLGEKGEAIEDCSKAINLNSDYIRARLRRAQLYEQTENLDAALEDYKVVLRKDPSLHQARDAVFRLTEEINERNEKLKQEMFGKLKDIGNLMLRPFGMSTDNFLVQQNETGSYNIQFSQNAPTD
ncbi:tetratricopeptide repeat protein 1-like [Ciona intestinalis]